MLQKLAKNTSIDVMNKWVGDWRMQGVCRKKTWYTGLFYFDKDS